jgi:hypothetical protein
MARLRPGGAFESAGLSASDSLVIRGQITLGGEIVVTAQLGLPGQIGDA